MVQLIFLILNVLTVSIAAMLSVWSWRSRKKVEARWLLIFSLSLTLIAICTINVYTQTTFEMKVFFSRLRFLGFTWLGLSWVLFFITSFEGWNFLKKGFLKFLIFSTPVITSIIVLTPSLSHHMVNNFTPFYWESMHLVRFETGRWFSVHLLLTYVTITLALIYSYNRYRFLSKLQRRQILLIFSGAFLGLAIDMFCVLTNNSLRWAMVSGSTYLFSIGAILYSVLNQGLLDISPLAKEKIFREFPEPVLIVDDQDILQDFNRAAERLFHLDSSILEKSWSSHAQKIGLSHSEIPDEVILLLDDNSPRYFRLSIDRLEEYSIKNGKILFFREITSQRNIEAKLNNHLEFKARLLSMIAHDFSGFLDAQRILSTNLEKQVQPELKTHAGFLADSVFASKDFMTNIILWARAQENKFEPIKRPFEMNMLIKDLLNSLEAHINLHETKIQFTPSSSPVIVQGDSVMIESVIRNLLHNAIRVSTPGKKIDIKIDTTSLNFVEVAIKDQGGGMTQAQIEAIYKSYTEPEAKIMEERDVHGLGLSIVQRFLELHNGDFKIDSTLGEGTFVRFSLPL